MLETIRVYSMELAERHLANGGKVDQIFLDSLGRAARDAARDVVLEMSMEELLNRTKKSRPRVKEKMLAKMKGDGFFQ